MLEVAMPRRVLQRFAAWIILITVTDDDINYEISVDESDDGDPNHIHVTPINHLIEHEKNNEGDCPCGAEVQPVEREDGSIAWLYSHNALDGRDLEEQGQGVPLENPHGLLDDFDGME